MAAREGHIERKPAFTPGKFVWLFFTWPILLLWKLVTFTCNAIGILLALFLGSALMVGGYVLTSTIIGALLGLPMMFFGFFLVVRALY